MVRAQAPENACAALRGDVLEEPVPVLPPEWRWSPPIISMDRMYGTRRSR
jgi:hypothetical protein